MIRLHRQWRAIDPRHRISVSPKKIPTFAGSFDLLCVVRIQMSWGDFAGTVSHHALEMQLIVGRPPVSYLCARSRMSICLGLPVERTQ